MRKLLFPALAAAALLAQSSSSYRVTHTYALGGDGSWDYVVPDPPHHRVFIARQTRVMVVDEDNGTLLGEVTGIKARTARPSPRLPGTASPPRATTSPWSCSI